MTLNIPLKDRDSILRSTTMDVDRIMKAVREILIGIGEDPDREGLKRTPLRVAKMYAEVCSGMDENPEDVCGETFSEQYDEIVLVRDIPFSSLCEHHLLPFIGRAHVAYIPAGKVLGLSKLARIVDVFAARPQVQERLTNQIADLLRRKVNAQAVAVVMEATHSCMTIRGVKKAGSTTLTSALRGRFLKDADCRAEVMALIQRNCGGHF